MSVVVVGGFVYKCILCVYVCDSVYVYSTSGEDFSGPPAGFTTAGGQENPARGDSQAWVWRCFLLGAPPPASAPQTVRGFVYRGPRFRHTNGATFPY